MTTSNPIDPWESILSIVHPDYAQLKDSWVKGPVIKPIISVKGKKTVLAFEEYFNDSGEYSAFKFLDNIIDEINKELENWKDVRRIAFNMWEFRRRQDAEKFLTLFHLKWPQ